MWGLGLRGLGFKGSERWRSKVPHKIVDGGVFSLLPSKDEPALQGLQGLGFREPPNRVSSCVNLKDGSCDEEH